MAIEYKRRREEHRTQFFLKRFQTDLGSDQWFSRQLNDRMKSGMSYLQAIEEIVPLYTHIQRIIDLSLTEPMLVEDLAQIKQKCKHVICLTARAFSLAERTLHQLAKNKLSFHIPEVEEFHLTLTHPLFFKHGVLFCGSNSKGDALEALLKYVQYKPSQIIFIDDKEANLYAVQTTAKKMNIEFCGLRYCGCDDSIHQYNSEKVAQELDAFLTKHPL